MSLHIPRYSALMRYAKILGFGEIHTKIDNKTGLQAIIAVHSTTLGPAIGGCRCYSYSAPELALKDALRLAYGMTLKAAACGLPHGGGKSVIIKPKNLTDPKARENLFRSFGDFIQEIQGRYITAVDLGSTLDDMTTIFERTPYVIGAKGPGRVDEDPSPATARGIVCAMRAAAKFKWGRDDLKELKIAIQGAGRVGLSLAEYCIEAGATVYIADVNSDAIKQAETFGAIAVATDQIEAVDCDIYAPCAFGGTITHHFIHRVKAKVIAGSANNQLAHHKNTEVMQQLGILYLPDFLINSGGLINAAMTYTYQNVEIANEKIDHIYDATLQVLERAAASGKTTTRVAEEIAFERLARGK